jgi:hypothetical protein
MIISPLKNEEESRLQRERDTDEANLHSRPHGQAECAAFRDGEYVGGPNCAEDHQGPS